MTQFSQRTQWDLSANALADSLNQRRSSGRDVYDLTVANPTRCGFQNISPAFFWPLAAMENGVYDPDPRGMVSARRVVADYYARQGVAVPLDRIFLTASTSEGYGFLFRLLADPNDHVIFPKPSYPLFEFLADLHDLDWRTYNLIYTDRWHLDEDGFKQALDDQTKAVILVNPNNPTGSCLNPNDLRVVVNQCAARSIPLICDEVFLDYLYDAHSTVGSLASNTQGLTFVLGGLSKLLALPQMKCSWIVVNGPDAMVCEAMARLEVIADTFLSINTPVQNALGRWMKAKDKIQGRVRERICANRMFLQTAAGASGGAMQLLDADGGWSAVVRLRDNVDEDAFVSRLLEDEGVFVHPGYFFDFSEGAHFVVSLLPEKKVFQEGVRRIIRHVKG